MTERQAPNSDQAEFWNGPGGETWTRQRKQFNTMLRPIGLEVLKRAQAQAGEHVLDVGCGTGETTSDLARLVTPGGSATGLDISDLMLAEARRHNQGHDVPVQFHTADAQNYAFDDDAYDLIFSRFGVMFFEDSVAAFANLGRALKSTGRLTFVCWQSVDRNAWVHLPRDIVAQHIVLDGPGTKSNAPGPFAFGDEGRALSLLNQAGFDDVTVEAHETDVLMGGGGSIETAVHAVTDQGPLSRVIHDAPEAVQTRIRDDLTMMLAGHQHDDGVRLGAGVWLVSARP